MGRVAITPPLWPRVASLGDCQEVLDSLDRGVQFDERGNLETSPYFRRRSESNINNVFREIGVTAEEASQGLRQIGKAMRGIRS